jgi:hypothetical protein
MNFPDIFQSQVTKDSNSVFRYSQAEVPKHFAITADFLIDAQKRWIDSFLSIVEAYRLGNDARCAAMQMIERLYDYAHGPVLFKPTLACGSQAFRTTFAGAVSYFVGGDPDFPDDHGFARNDWISVYPQSNHFRVEGNIGMTMGNFVFVKSSGFELVVEKTFIFKSNNSGELRIVLHHASLPFAQNQ